MYCLLSLLGTLVSTKERHARRQHTDRDFADERQRNLQERRLLDVRRHGVEKANTWMGRDLRISVGEALCRVTPYNKTACKLQL